MKSKLHFLRIICISIIMTIIALVLVSCKGVSKNTILKEDIDEKEISISDQTELKVRMYLGDINITKSKDDKMKIRIKTTVEGKDDNTIEKMLSYLKHDVRNNKDTIEMNSTKKTDLPGIRNINSIVDIQVPSKIRNIYIDSEVGNIDILSDIQKGEIKTNVGDINIFTKNSESIILSTSTGNINLEGKIKDITAKSEIGDINIFTSEVKKLIAKAGKGNIKSQMNDIDSLGIYEFKNDTGNIDIRVPKDIPINVDDYNEKEIQDLTHEKITLQGILLKENGVRLYIDLRQVGKVKLQGI
ncbi:hypothetical protein CLPU_20c00400 [Gottschalkia purinilytica]|uniref:Adhesin domain-containing protein n=1 Tax=Gottschalkia purinilytica TaxID=1503 RepID=A0A0L0W6X2_GOTPU|nr:hypothetical protein [Gottschalkia purinilytica]KNF07264.1 hypothetical protein CLPU_20c00400 [Gottschalkia purinilytica]